jgi:hypothetical protein
MLKFFRKSTFEPQIKRMFGLAQILIRAKSAKSLNPINPRFLC